MSPQMRPLAALLLLGACLLLPPTVAFAGDLDADGVPDETDNCTSVANPAQVDTDGDGFGNRCDPDFDQNGVVNFVDLVRLKQKFFQADALTDLNGDGVVNFADLAILKASFFRAPGPKCASCPIDPCEQGRALLCPGLSVVAADTALEKCLATIDPVSRPQQFQTATFLLGITRVARPAFEAKPGPDPTRIDGLSEALDALGVGSAGRDPLDFMPTLPLLPDGSCTVPERVYEADVESALQADLMPQLDAALAALPAVPAGWSDHCDVLRFGRTASVEIDGSDVLLLRAHLHALLPPFVGDDAAVDSLPDPTFGGLLPGQRSGDLRCVVDEKGPLISVAPGDPRSSPPPPLTSEPVHLSIRIQDPAVGASPGSAIDPASISVRLYPNPFGAAPPPPAAAPGWVVSRFQRAPTSHSDSRGRLLPTGPCCSKLTST